MFQRFCFFADEQEQPTLSKKWVATNLLNGLGIFCPTSNAGEWRTTPPVNANGPGCSLDSILPTSTVINRSLMTLFPTRVPTGRTTLSAIVAEGGGSNLWPWYWCIDTRDNLALCWGAPAGVEPEAGDTLLMITLKLGMEVTTRACLFMAPGM